MSNRGKKTLNVSEQRCRFYEDEFPKVDELCLVRFDSVDNTGCYYVSLLEYDMKQGMILQSEISRRRVRSVSKIARVGQVHVASVLRVDSQHGFIDLSKKNVEESEVHMAEERYANAKLVHTVMAQLAAITEIPLLELNEHITWPLYRKYKHGYNAFMQILETGPEIVDEWKKEGVEDLDFELLEKVFDTLYEHITRRLAPSPKKVKAVLNVTCFCPRGVELIRDALRAAEAVDCGDIALTVRLDVAPEYVIETTSSNVREAKLAITKAIEAAKSVIVSGNGTCIVTHEPNVLDEAAEEKK
ncbi:Translation initiation factor 2 alpha subunit [Carpediemonas membranifera]|uniref:Translation initiation factor 2 alpha subunit n=1 Tax=Carpediemonas membranifera TaxID=201153 RepID=A0A8J6E378_9EUKA|nr:Translation initiation factor 2 alpha subunit [Carpediemonas membranifera]|eukprot:KAG9395261.1 Translation initiation factor 2 alpha subunit [Carpediemonas membranifera]